MIRTIKIRFIEKGKSPYYSIQKKTWYGLWRYIGWTMDMGYGSVFNIYTDSDKNKLLDDVIKSHYGLNKEFVKVIEYPSIKIY